MLPVPLAFASTGRRDSATAGCPAVSPPVTDPPLPPAAIPAASPEEVSTPTSAAAVESVTTGSVETVSAVTLVGSRTLMRLRGRMDKGRMLLGIRRRGGEWCGG